MSRTTPRAVLRACQALVVALLLIGVAACSGTDSELAGNSVEELKFGAVGAGVATTDPHGQLFNESDWARLSAVLDTLTVAGEDGRPAPALAESWTASPDATEWTFKLRQNAKFSDGSPVSAEDALFSIGRLQEKKAENGNRVGTLDLERSKALDEHTLVLATPAPDAELPRSLTLGSFVVKKGTKDFTKLIGSGPFVLNGLSGQTADLSASDTWWGGRAGVDKLQILSFSDPQSMGQAVSSGQIDVASGVQPATAKSAAEGGKIKVSTRAGGEVVPLLLRMDTKPFDDPRVREAIKLSLDRPKLVDQVYLGYGTTGRDMIKLNDPEVPTDVPQPPHDPARAKQLLAEAGHPDGFSTVLHTSTSYPAMLPLATAVKGQLAEVGIDVELKQHAPDQYWTTAYGVEPFTVGYYSGSAPFVSLLRATVLSDAAYSEIGWADRSFDEAYAAAMATVDEGQRSTALAGLHHRMAAEGGWVVWGFGDRITLHSPKVQGIPTTGNQYNLSKITVAD